MNYLVETKTEYTIQLTNILVPLIYEGITSIYEDAIKIANQDEELKTFQIFLKKIPKWNNNLLENETKRILYISTCSELLKNLVDAVIKANIMILTNTHPSNKSSLKINTKFDFKEFIHNCYIESARIFYNNPYLFYHKHSIYDINRNQKDAKENIKNAIIEAIRKMLPLKMIINEYLGNSFKDDSNVNIDVTLSEAEKHNLNNMIKIDCTKDNDFIKIPEEFKIESESQSKQKNKKKNNYNHEKNDYNHEKNDYNHEKNDYNHEKDKEDENDKEDEKDKEDENDNDCNHEKKSENKIIRKSEQELKDRLEIKLSSNKKLENKYIEDECESISYYKTDVKKKVEDSFSNINTQQIFYNNFSVELSDEAKMTDKNKLNININKPRKIIN